MQCCDNSKDDKFDSFGLNELPKYIDQNDSQSMVTSINLILNDFIVINHLFPNF